MILFVPLSGFAFVSLVSLLSNSIPFVLNLWFSGFTGVMSWFLLMEDNLSGAMVLLMVEESCSLLVLLSWSMGWSVLLSVMIMMKGALAPLHYWFVSVLAFSKSFSLMWGISCHKLPVLGAAMGMGLVSSFVVLFVGFGMGVCLMFLFNTINSMFILSSANTLATVLILLCFSCFSGVLFFLCYIGVVSAVLVFPLPSISSSFLLMGLMGLPPFLFLQLKWVVMSVLLGSQAGFGLGLGLLSAVAVVAYVRFVLLVSLEVTLVGGSALFFFWLPLSVVLPMC